MNLDYWIIIIFLGGTLLYGIMRGRGVKTIRDYSIGNKRISRFALTATVAATIIGGGSVMGNTALVYKLGVIIFLGSIFECLNYLIVARWVAPMFMNNKCLSIGEYVGMHYGSLGRVVTGLAGFVLCSAGIGAQITAIGYTTHYFLGLSPGLGILCAFGSIILYSAFGGFRSVVATDVIQFLVLVVAFPMVAVFALHKVGGIEVLINQVPKDHLSFFPNAEIGWTYWLIFASYAIPGFEPQLTQRLFASRDVKKAQKSFLVSGLLLIPLGGIVMITGLSSSILFPGIEPHTALLQVIDVFLPTGIKGIAICGIFAVVLSTADSLLNAGSILLVHDVYKPLTKKQPPSEKELHMIRWMTLIVGTTAMFIAIYHKAIFSMVRFGYTTWEPLVAVPVFAILLGYHPSKKAYAVATLVTFTTVMVWSYFRDYLIIEANYAGLLINGILLFSVDRKNLKKKTSLRQKIKSAIMKKGMRYAFFRQWRQFFRERVADREPQYKSFAIIMIIYLVSFYQYYSWVTVEVVLGGDHMGFYVNFLYLSAGLCFLLLFHKSVSPLYDTWVSWIWLVALALSLPFLSFIYFLIVGYDPLSLVNLGASLVLLLLLVDWLIAFILYPLSLYAACLVVNAYYPTLFASHGVDAKVFGVYLTLFIGIVGLIFLRNQKLLFKEKMATLNALSGAIAHEIRTPLAVIGNIQYAMKVRINKFHNEPLTQSSHDKLINDLNEHLKLIQNSKRNADNIINMLLAKIREGVREEPQELSALAVVKQSLEDYGFRSNERKMVDVSGEDFMFKGTEDGLKHIIFNLIKNSIYYVKKANRADVSGAITIELCTKMRDYNVITFKDLGTGISRDDLPYLFDRFYTKTHHGTGLGLYFCKSVMEDFGGIIECQSQEGEYTEFKMLFPKLDV